MMNNAIVVKYLKLRLRFSFSWMPLFSNTSRRIHFDRCVVPLMSLLIFSKFIVPTPLEGKRTIYSNGSFFGQSILADRYIHRRELRLVSLESLSSLEYGIKKVFLIFLFTGSYRGLNYEKIVWFPVRFYSHFPEFLTKTSPILLKFDNFFRKCCWFLFVKTKKFF